MGLSSNGPNSKVNTFASYRKSDGPAMRRNKAVHIHILKLSENCVVDNHMVKIEGLLKCKGYKYNYSPKH